MADKSLFATPYCVGVNCLVQSIQISFSRAPETRTFTLWTIRTAWRTAARKAGLADRRIYDLRATFASRANVCHATGLTVAHLLGHASTQILPTYVRPLDENTRALIEAMDTARKNQRVAPHSIN